MPEIFNTDQGAQFTSTEFIGVPKQHQIRISMDGRGCWRDNVFSERPWKTIKYGENLSTRLRECLSPLAQASLATCSSSTRAVHTALDRRTPAAVYLNSLPLAAAA